MQDLDGSLGTGQKLRSSVSFEIMLDEHFFLKED